MNDTLQRKYDKVDSPYNKWIREQEPLSSHIGVRCTDTDLNVFNCNTLHYYQIEDKTNAAHPTPSQLIMFQLNRIMWETGDKEQVKQYLQQYMKYKPNDFVKRNLVYSGYWLIKYERNDLTVGSGSLFKLMNEGFKHAFTIPQNDNNSLIMWNKYMLGMIGTETKE